MTILSETKNIQTMNLSLFGWPEDLLDVDALKLMTQIVEAYDYQPDYGILGTPDTYKVRVLKLSNTKKKFTMPGRPEYDSIDMFQSMWGDGQSDWRWISSVEYYVRRGRKRLAVRCVIRERSDLSNYFEKAVDLVLAEISPAYGYSSILPLNWNPPAYDDGAIYGIEDVKEQQRISNWRNECFWRPGGSNFDLMRDVFSVNFLNKRHMAREIDNMPLADWAATRRLGTVAPLKPGLWKWTLSSSQAALARPALLEAKHLAVTV